MPARDATHVGPEPLITVADAKRAARTWVRQVAARFAGFQGAFLHGSILEMADDQPFPPSSDVDVGVVFATGTGPAKIGKTLCDGVLVDGAAFAADRLATAEQLLADYRLGPSFRRDGILADPDGHLGRVQSRVAREFTARRWVLARCDDAVNNCRKYVDSLDPSTAHPTQALCWLFAEGCLAHVLLAAGLRNPTVRRRYAAVGALLASTGRLALHDELLAMLGCESMSRSRVAHHLDQMTAAFDRAAAVIRSEFPFAADVTEAARPVAVGGSLELIARAEHREAVFWIAVTYARCLTVLATDGAPDAADDHEPGFRCLMSDLGVDSYEAMRRRAAEIEAFLPELRTRAEKLASEHPGVRPG